MGPLAMIHISNGDANLRRAENTYARSDSFERVSTSETTLHLLQLTVSQVLDCLFVKLQLAGDRIASFPGPALLLFLGYHRKAPF